MIQVRPRRLRTTPAMRRLVREVEVRPSQLVLPMFVAERRGDISSMPAVVRHDLDSLRAAAEDAVAAGVGALMLFGVPDDDAKDDRGSQGWAEDGILQRGLAAVRDAVGDETVVMADTCLDEFTSHGHCGFLTPDGRVDNDATLAAYASMAVAQARAGAHIVAPSGMMDGQVAAIRAGLDGEGFSDVGILAYGAKYASAFYGPFRDAVGSAANLGKANKKVYQTAPWPMQACPASALRWSAPDRSHQACWRTSSYRTCRNVYCPRRKCPLRKSAASPEHDSTPAPAATGRKYAGRTWRKSPEPAGLQPSRCLRRTRPHAPR